MAQPHYELRILWDRFFDDESYFGQTRLRFTNQRPGATHENNMERAIAVFRFWWETGILRPFLTQQLGIGSVRMRTVGFTPVVERIFLTFSSGDGGNVAINMGRCIVVRTFTGINDRANTGRIYLPGFGEFSGSIRRGRPNLVQRDVAHTAMTDLMLQLADQDIRLEHLSRSLDLIRPVVGYAAPFLIWGSQRGRWRGDRREPIYL